MTQPEPSSRFHRVPLLRKFLPELVLERVVLVLIVPAGIIPLVLELLGLGSLLGDGRASEVWLLELLEFVLLIKLFLLLRGRLLGLLLLLLLHLVLGHFLHLLAFLNPPKG